MLVMIHEFEYELKRFKKIKSPHRWLILEKIKSLPQCQIQLGCRWQSVPK